MNPKQHFKRLAQLVDEICLLYYLIQEEKYWDRIERLRNKKRLLKIEADEIQNK